MSEKILEKKIVGFWIRFLSILIDVLLFCLIALSSSLMCIENKEFAQINKTITQVKNNYLYYLWFLLIITLLVIQFLILPLLLKGKTLGMLITRLELNPCDQSLNHVILKRFQFGALFWILMIVIFMIFVNPIIINKMVIVKAIENMEKTDLTNDLLNQNKWTIAESILYSIPSLSSPIILFLELFLFMSVGFKKNKIGIIDKLTNSQIVFINKYNEVNNLVIKIIEPIKNNQYQIEWKE